MFVEALGTHVHAADFGAGDRTVVGLTGAFGTWEIWQPPFERLSRRARVVAYDHLGAGATHAPPEAVTFENLVALVPAVLDGLGVERCVLAADSAQVAVAVEAAARWPGRVEALALVAGGVAHPPSPVVAGFVAALRADAPAAVGAFVDLCVPEPDAAHLRAWLRAIVLRTGGERAAALVEAFVGVDVSNRVPGLAMPTAVVCGTADALPGSSLAEMQALAEAFPDATLEVLDGAGHVPTLARPAAVAAVLERLLDRSRP